MKKFLIKVNGNQYEVEVEEVKDTGSVAQATKELSSAPAAPSTPAFSAPAPAQPAPTRVSAPEPAKKETAIPACSVAIKAPMPGTILSVNVNSGDAVKKGQILLILEAMKMENEIVAPADGKVLSVNVCKGVSVNAGDVLVVMS